MATFITLIDFTEQGIGALGQTTARARAFRDRASELGVTVREIFWTLGDHDGVVILEGEEKAVTAVLLWLGSQGNVRTNTLRAFGREEIQEILAHGLG